MYYEVTNISSGVAYGYRWLEEKKGSKMEVPDSNQPIWKVIRSF